MPAMEETGTQWRQKDQEHETLPNAGLNPSENLGGKPSTVLSDEWLPGESDETSLIMLSTAASAG